MDTDFVLQTAYNIVDMDGAVSFLQSIPRFSDVSPKEHFLQSKAFYDFLSLEDLRRKVFHVAGTNGKGSVCAFLASIHKCMNKSVGLFTSPHLCDIRERIVLNGQMISKEDFVSHLKIVTHKLEEFRSDPACSTYMPLYFDFLFFIAASYYKKMSPDAVIWETGLGGRLDATNVTDKKDVCIITEIGLDHMEYLGDTKAQIAGEKAGIMRKGVPVISTARCDEVTEVLLRAADDTGAPIRFVPGYEDIAMTIHDKMIDFSYESDYYNNATLAVEGRAVYQAENAMLSASAMEQVYDRRELSLDLIRQGLMSMNWPGRLEEIEHNVFYDGAHNMDGIEALLKSVGEDGCPGRRYMLFSAVTDKQSDRMLKAVADSGLFAWIIMAPMHTERSIDIAGLESRAADLRSGRTDIRIDVCGELMNAYHMLTAKIDEADRIYVCGSLYIYGELKDCLRAHTEDKKDGYAHQGGAS